MVGGARNLSENFHFKPSPNTPRTWLSTTLEHHFDMLLCFLLLTRSTGPHHRVEVSVIDGVKMEITLCDSIPPFGI